MEKKPLISIIVPVYNAGQYLSRCIDSLLIQDIYELILVNDGSTDNSREICDKYGAHDERIRVFHCENNGVSVARNIGISNAQGDWIAFVDADDWVESNWCSVLKSNIELHNCDLYTFGYNRVSETEKLSTNILKKAIETNFNFITTSNYHYAVWAYIFLKVYYQTICDKVSCRS
jgi:glycosyltransferase involved in cell wall biosynthesis